MKKASKYCWILSITLIFILIYSCKKKIVIDQNNVSSISGVIYYDYKNGGDPSKLDYIFSNKDTIKRIIKIINECQPVYYDQKGKLADVRLYINYKNSENKCLIIYLALDKSAMVLLHNGCNEGVIIGKYRNPDLHSFFTNYLDSRGVHLNFDIN